MTFALAFDSLPFGTTFALSFALWSRKLSWCLWPLYHCHNWVKATAGAHLVEMGLCVHIRREDLIVLFRVEVLFSLLVGRVLIATCIVRFIFIPWFFILFPIGLIFNLLFVIVAGVVGCLQLGWTSVPSSSSWSLILGILPQDEVHSFHSPFQGQPIFAQLRHHQLPLFSGNTASPQVPPRSNLLRQIDLVSCSKTSLGVLEVLSVVLQRLSLPPLQLNKEGLEVIGKLGEGLVLECSIKAFEHRLIWPFSLQVVDAHVLDQIPSTPLKKCNDVEHRLLLPTRQLHLCFIQIASAPELPVVRLPSRKDRHVSICLASESSVATISSRGWRTCSRHLRCHGWRTSPTSGTALSKGKMLALGLLKPICFHQGDQVQGVTGVANAPLPTTRVSHTLSWPTTQKKVSLTHRSEAYALFDSSACILPAIGGWTSNVWQTIDILYIYICIYAHPTISIVKCRPTRFFINNSRGFRFDTGVGNTSLQFYSCEAREIKRVKMTTFSIIPVRRVLTNADFWIKGAAQFSIPSLGDGRCMNTATAVIYTDDDFSPPPS